MPSFAKPAPTSFMMFQISNSKIRIHLVKNEVQTEDLFDARIRTEIHVEKSTQTVMRNCLTVTDPGMQKTQRAINEVVQTDLRHPQVKSPLFNARFD